MKKTNYSYIGISFVILLFGIYAVPKIVDRLSAPDLATIGEVPPYSFTDQNGKTITNADYKGKVYVAEFFFASCTDICPIMTENLTLVQDEFFGNPKVGMASFTIDPQHDTPEILQQYAEDHKITKPTWHLLTGDKTKILKLANEGFKLHASESKDMEDPDAETIFEHSGFFALIDQDGNIRSRVDENDNPIVYYDGLDKDDVQMLIQDIHKLL